MDEVSGTHRHEGVVRLYLVPELGSKRLAKLAAQDVRVFITRIGAQCLCCKHGIDAARGEPQCCARPAGDCCASRISVRMVQSIHAVLRNALESAVREEVIPRNVAKLVKVTTPKYAVNRGLSVVQARQVLKAANANASTRSTSWRSASACAVASCSASAGKTPISKQAPSK